VALPPAPLHVSAPDVDSILSGPPPRLGDVPDAEQTETMSCRGGSLKRRDRDLRLNKGQQWVLLGAAVIMLLIAVGRLTDHDGGTSAVTCFMLAVVLAVAGLSSRPAR
jgi:hypothetical protein